METLDRRRRRGSAGGDPLEAGSAHPSLESETALSHGPVSYAPDHMPAPVTGNIPNGPWTPRGVFRGHGIRPGGKASWGPSWANRVSLP